MGARPKSCWGLEPAPIIGIDWWQGSNDLAANIHYAADATARTTFPHLAPLDGAGSDGWRTTGTGVDSSTIFGNALARYRGALTGVMYAHYPPEALTGATYAESQIYRNYLAHAARHAAGLDLDVKRCMYLQNWITAAGATAAQYAADIVSEMSRPGWLMYKDRPVIGLYGDTLLNTSLAAWTAFRAMLPQNIYVIVLGSASPTELTNVGANTYVSYGPNGTSMSPNGEHTWADNEAICQARWGATGSRDVGLSVTLGNDQRARRADPPGASTAWCNAPSTVQWMHLNAQGGASYPRVIYAATEPTEGSPTLWGTAQRPTLYTDGLRFLKLSVGHLSRPTAYVDKVNVGALGVFARAGATNNWSRTFGGGAVIAGALDSDLRYLTDVTDTLTGSFDWCTRIQIYGQRGAGCGNVTVTVDGGAPVVVDTSTGSGQGNLIFDSGALTEGTHTIVLAGHASNAGAGRVAALDYAAPTVNMRNVTYTIAT